MSSSPTDMTQVLCASELGLQQVRGQYCWGGHYMDGLNLSMSFGRPRLEVVREPYRSRSTDEEVRRRAAQRMVTVKGEWWLWVYVAYWRILANEQALASYSSSMRKKKRAIVSLEGQKLTDVRVNVRTGATRFLFDLGGRLEVRRRERRTGDELWLLYKPSGYVLSVRGDGTYDHEPGSGTDKRPRVVRRSLAALRPVTRHA